jgi:hypothetical protein
MRATPRRLALIVLLVVGASACSQPGSPGTGPAPSSNGGGDVLDFTAPLVGGGTLHGAEYAGEDVAIWFWAPW